MEKKLVYTGKTKNVYALPTGIPVATVAVNGGANAALLAAQILAVSDADIAAKLDAKRVADAKVVLEKDAGVMDKL